MIGAKALLADLNGALRQPSLRLEIPGPGLGLRVASQDREDAWIGGPEGLRQHRDRLFEVAVGLGGIPRTFGSHAEPAKARRLAVRVPYAGRQLACRI